MRTYRQLEGDWYYRDGKFFHLHEAKKHNLSGTTWRAFAPVKDSLIMPYCMQCQKEIPDDLLPVYELQKLRGKV